MQIADIIAKRKVIWEARHDIDYDKRFGEAAINSILASCEMRRELYEKPYLLIEAVFQIVNKDKKTEPFFLNEVQIDFIAQFEANGTKRPYLILKGRQQGFTSLITAMQLSYAIVKKNFSGYTIAHRRDTVGAIFNNKARTVLDRLPRRLKPTQKFNSKNELFFSKLNSSWRVAVASPNVGRGDTFNFVHLSEAAFFECALSDVQEGIGEAIAEGGIQIFESTANGFNEFETLWREGDCVKLFYEWWRTKEYRSTEYEYLDKTDAWLEARKKLLFDLGLDREQVTWYCKKYNSYVDKASIRQEYPITPAEAFISTGECVFDKDLIYARLAELGSKRVGRLGYFEYKKRCEPIHDEQGEVIGDEWFIEDIRFCESADGYITLHEEPTVKRDREGEIVGLAPYAIGGDTADSGLDYFTAKVVSVMNGRCYATMRKQKMDEELYAEQIYCLGRYYNDARVAIEVNYSRHPIRVLRKYRYPNLYMRRRVDGMTDLVERDYGFETTRQTKPIIIAELTSAFREDPSIECDGETLHEMLSFVKKENGRQEASVGQHDDLVMASAIAHFVASNCDARYRDVGEGKPDFIESNFGRHDAGDQEYMDW